MKLYQSKNKKIKSKPSRKKQIKRHKRTYKNKKGGGIEHPSNSEIVSTSSTVDQLLNELGVTYTDMNDEALRPITDELSILSNELGDLVESLEKLAEQKKTISNLLLKFTNGEIPKEKNTAANKEQISELYVYLVDQFNSLLETFNKKKSRYNELNERFIQLMSG
jgi:hypothetical protein